MQEIFLWVQNNAVLILAVIGAIGAGSSALSIALQALASSMAKAALKTKTKVDDGAAGFLAWSAKTFAIIATFAESLNGLIRITAARGTGDKVKDVDRKQTVELAQKRTSTPPPVKSDS